MTIVVVDGTLQRHLARALAAGAPAHRAWCRVNGVPYPAAELDALQRALRRPELPGAVPSGHVFDPPAGDGHALLMSYQQAGERLNVSARTIARMARDGRLEAVAIGRRRLVRAADLDRLAGR